MTTPTLREIDNAIRRFSPVDGDAEDINALCRDICTFLINLHTALESKEPEVKPGWATKLPTGVTSEDETGDYLFRPVDLSNLESKPLERELSKIAKYRHHEHPGQWYLTDFTMEQIERRLGYLERENHALHDELVRTRIKLLVCPGCGGETEHDRCLPPNPYYCDKCAKETTE